MRNPGSYFPDEYKCIPFKRATKADKLTVKGIIDGEIDNRMWNEIVGEIDNRGIVWHMRPEDFAPNFPYWFEVRTRPLARIRPFILVPMVETGLDIVEQHFVRLVFECHPLKTKRMGDSMKQFTSLCYGWR